MPDIFKYIKANKFFSEYAKNVPAWKKKVSGKNSNGNPIDFTPDEKKQIRQGLKQMIKDLVNSFYISL